MLDVDWNASTWHPNTGTVASRSPKPSSSRSGKNARRFTGSRRDDAGPALFTSQLQSPSICVTPMASQISSVISGERSAVSSSQSSTGALPSTGSAPGTQPPSGASPSTHGVSALARTAEHAATGAADSGSSPHRPTVGSSKAPSPSQSGYHTCAGKLSGSSSMQSAIAASGGGAPAANANQPPSGGSASVHGVVPGASASDTAHADTAASRKKPSPSQSANQARPGNSDASASSQSSAKPLLARQRAGSAGAPHGDAADAPVTPHTPDATPSRSKKPSASQSGYQSCSAVPVASSSPQSALGPAGAGAPGDQGNQPLSGAAASAHGVAASASSTAQAMVAAVENAPSPSQSAYHGRPGYSDSSASSQSAAPPGAALMNTTPAPHATAATASASRHAVSGAGRCAPSPSQSAYQVWPGNSSARASLQSAFAPGSVRVNAPRPRSTSGSEVSQSKRDSASARPQAANDVPWWKPSPSQSGNQFSTNCAGGSSSLQSCCAAGGIGTAADHGHQPPSGACPSSHSDPAFASSSEHAGPAMGVSSYATSPSQSAYHSRPGNSVPSASSQSLSTDGVVAHAAGFGPDAQGWRVSASRAPHAVTAGASVNVSASQSRYHTSLVLPVASSSAQSTSAPSGAGTAADHGHHPPSGA